MPNVSLAQHLEGGAFLLLPYASLISIPFYCWVDSEFSSRRVIKPYSNSRPSEDFLHHRQVTFTSCLCASLKKEPNKKSLIFCNFT